MMGLIGYQDDVIGFGLAGLEKVFEVKKTISREKIIDKIKEMSKEVKIIIINESIKDKVKDLKFNVLFIEIPEDKTKTNIDEIDKITMETIGITR